MHFFVIIFEHTECFLNQIHIPKDISMVLS